MKTLYLILCFLIICTIHLSGETSSRFGYADFLKNSKRYEIALAEYYRAMYQGAEEDTLRALYGIADCYENKQLYLEAASIFEQIETRNNDNWTAIYKHVVMLNKIRYFYESNIVIDKHLNLQSVGRQDTLLLYKTVNLINLGRYSDAKQTIGSITAGYPKTRASEISEVMNRNLPLKYKNKTKAFLLQTVLPGSAYLYCDMPQTALATLVVNSLMGYTIYDNFRQGNTGSGVFFSVIGTGFYLGSIYGSLQAVSKYNYRELEEFSIKIIP